MRFLLVWLVGFIVTWLVIKVDDGKNPFMDVVLSIAWPFTWLFLLKATIFGDMKWRSTRKG